ncbi:MAG: class I SAM-dependent methyltransferase [Bacteroidetes bacterium]|nr:class I SAM-dependent methyltransferase [Bacteroidota bacterium]
MEEIKEQYKSAFKLYGDSSKSVLWPKGRQADRFSALTNHIKKDTSFSVLDFGCGLAHLKPFLDSKFSNYSYTGVDVVEDFIAHNKQKYSNANFMLLHEFEKQSHIKFDYVFASGVFNILYDKSPENHKQQVFSILKKLFAQTTNYLSVDFATDLVDFTQPTTFHANPGEISSFCMQHLSRRFVLNHSYLPYEFCIAVFKDISIKRPENCYEHE